MDGPPFFTDEIRAIANGLRQDALSHSHPNRAESRIDHLGRQLHGIGFVRHREIADAFTAALRELAASHALPEETRAAAVNRAAAHLEAALDAAAEGMPS